MTVEANSEVKYRAYPLHPDYLSELEGSTVNGRALEPLPFDGRKLGKLLALVRPPIPEFTVLGGMMVDRNDIFHLLRSTKRLRRSGTPQRYWAATCADRMRHKRGTQLVMGNALVRRSLYSLAQQKNVALAIDTAVEGNHQRHLRRTSSFPEPEWRTPNRGASRAASSSRSKEINSHPGLRKRDAAREHRSGLVSGCTRAYQRQHTISSARWARTMALAASATLSGRRSRSRAPRQWQHGSVPHFLMDRGKPGVNTVNRSGKRFLNETTSYHLFGIAMQEENKQTDSIPAYLRHERGGIAQVRYRHGPTEQVRGLTPLIADGYLITSRHNIEGTRNENSTSISRA